MKIVMVKVKLGKENENEDEGSVMHGGDVVWGGKLGRKMWKTRRNIAARGAKVDVVVLQEVIWAASSPGAASTRCSNTAMTLNEKITQLLVDNAVIFF